MGEHSATPLVCPDRASEPRRRGRCWRESVSGASSGCHRGASVDDMAVQPMPVAAAMDVTAAAAETGPA